MFNRNCYYLCFGITKEGKFANVYAIQSVPDVLDNELLKKLDADNLKLVKEKLGKREPVFLNVTENDQLEKLALVPEEQIVPKLLSSISHEPEPIKPDTTNDKTLD